jgi:hypothetical protein
MLLLLLLSCCQHWRQTFSMQQPCLAAAMPNMMPAGDTNALATALLLLLLLLLQRAHAHWEQQGHARCLLMTQQGS